MTILTDFGYLHLSLKQKDILLKKLQSDFRWTLAYLALKIERNRIFHLYHEILNLSDFYRQALLTCKITHNYFASFYPQLLLLLLKEAKIHAFSLKNGLTTSYPLYVHGLRYHSFVKSIKVVNLK